MVKIKVWSLVGVLGIACLSACSSAPDANKSEPVIDRTDLSIKPEKITGKTDVYDSMARSVKYNINVTYPALKEKVFFNHAENPRQVINSILKMKDPSQNPMYDSLRALDFSIAYALANVSDDEAFVSENLKAKSAQTLALAAIKAHKDALLASKKIKEIDRQIRRLQSDIKILNEKQNRIGVLNSEDEAYKKGLEVVVYKLSEIRKTLEESLIVYRQLVKSDEKKIDLEGRNFYELDHLDAKLTVNDFRKTAFNYRPEFKIQKELSKKYSYEQVSQILRSEYPQVERLEINGYDAEKPMYIKELQQRADFQANYLVDKVWQYKNAPNAGSKKLLRLQAFEEMAAAIMTQNEVAYNIVMRAGIDYEEINKQIDALKKNIAQSSKKRGLTSTQKVDLWEQKIALLNLELKASQILAEKAVAIRAMYFYAGFNPFNTKLYDGKIKDISSNLKVGFNKDAVEMLSKVQAPQTAVRIEDNNWAKKENWLEELLENPNPKAEKPITLAQPKGDFEPYRGEEFNKRTIMQLGSYRYKENADLDWKMLKELYPDLREYNPVVEQANVRGKPMYRLIIQRKTGGFMEMCNKLRADKVGCLLR